MQLLVGFVNKFFGLKLNLGILDLEKNDFYWIFNEEIKKRIGAVKGVNGILKYKNHYIIGYQSNPTKIAVFTKDMKIVTVNIAEDIIDLHSFTNKNDLK